jgi:Gas vesicle protein G
MALLGILLTFPVSGPVLTAKAAIKTIFTEAERQLYDQAAIQEQLAMVERAYRAGELTEAEFADREEALLERLVEARRWRLEKAREGDAP